MNEYPFVTAIIVFRNEEKYIKKCFESFLAQDYPQDRYEIIVVDGMSDDNSKVLIGEGEKLFNQGVEVRYYENPKKTLASGWNMAIKEAKGQYVIRIDAHGYAPKSFISNSVGVMQKVGDAICVGGTLNTECTTPIGEKIAMVLSSPFGVGNSKFRYSTKAEYVDTVAFGLYRKNIFQQVGYFDENLKRNQDNDMHRRIRETGGKFYLDPKIQSTYISRDSIKGFLNQAWQNGKWNMTVLKKDIRTLRIRHLVPLGFVVGIISLLMIGIKFKIMWKLLAVILLTHLALGIIFSMKKTKRISDLVILPFIFISLHISYGLGSLVGIIGLLQKKS